jgi:hypothetical protein
LRRCSFVSHLLSSLSYDVLLVGGAQLVVTDLQDAPQLEVLQSCISAATFGFAGTYLSVLHPPPGNTVICMRRALHAAFLAVAREVHEIDFLAGRMERELASRPKIPRRAAWMDIQLDPAAWPGMKSISSPSCRTLSSPATITWATCAGCTNANFEISPMLVSRSRTDRSGSQRKRTSAVLMYDRYRAGAVTVETAASVELFKPLISCSPAAPRAQTSTCLDRTRCASGQLPRDVQKTFVEVCFRCNHYRPVAPKGAVNSLKTPSKPAK